jgi:glutamate:Na+ symporter, ESS family
MIFTSNPPLSDYSIYWNVMVQFGIVMTILLLANLLRRKVGFLKKSLLPVAVIGGFLGLFIRYFISGGIIPEFSIMIEGNSILSYPVLSGFTYHGIAFGFAALTLKGIDRFTGAVRKKPKAVASGMVIVNGYVIQGVFGILLTVIFSFFFTNIPNYAGFLLPMGFGQGPGQALSVGNVFQLQGFTYGVDFGLTVASIGFLAASIGGVIYLHGLNTERLTKYQVEENLDGSS